MDDELKNFKVRGLQYVLGRRDYDGRDRRVTIVRCCKFILEMSEFIYVYNCVVTT